MIREMPFKLPVILSVVASVFKDRADLVAENVALRHQLSWFIHRGPVCTQYRYVSVLIIRTP
jgi:hypothetical protein